MPTSATKLRQVASFEQWQAHNLSEPTASVGEPFVFLLLRPVVVD
eukprot:COSAG02_NODE_38107_length_433_cov_0.826347_1_plen_44_part_10